MKKLKLQAEALAVESFATAEAKEPHGTMQANVATWPAACDPFSEPPRCA